LVACTIALVAVGAVIDNFCAAERCVGNAGEREARHWPSFVVVAEQSPGDSCRPHPEAATVEIVRCMSIPGSRLIHRNRET
jgi:hypothetical protein